MLTITSLYAALLTILYIILSARTIMMRQTTKISLGTGDNEMMLRKTRAHGNFAEYVPLGLILLLICELSAHPMWLLHTAGILLLVGRLSHVYGVDQAKPQLKFRILGMILTFAALSLLAGRLLYTYAQVA